MWCPYSISNHNATTTNVLLSLGPMSCSQTLKESVSGYEADIEISAHIVDEEKTAVGEISKKEVPLNSKIFDNRIY